MLEEDRSQRSHQFGRLRQNDQRLISSAGLEPDSGCDRSSIGCSRRQKNGFEWSEVSRRCNLALLAKDRESGGFCQACEICKIPSLEDWRHDTVTKRSTLLARSSLEVS
jgi:hypothetical protein